LSEPTNGLTLDHRQAVKFLAGEDAVGSDKLESESEAEAGWLHDDPEFMAELNRVKLYRAERLRADLRSLTADAMATLRELVTSPDVAPSVRLRASLAILQAADVLKPDAIGPTTVDGVQAKIARDRFFDALG
jgi:hypothetical protein